jgi:cell division protein FtsL
VLGAAQRLERHRLLDRLIAGRAWIALVAFALIGIVTLQLGLLELNASVGRSLERSAALQRENAALAIENSELAAGGRVESLASRLDMELVPMGALRFLMVDPRVDASRAAAALSAPAKVAVPAPEAEATAGASAVAQAGAPEAEQASESSATEQAVEQGASTPAGDSQPGSGEASSAAASAQASVASPAAPQAPAPTPSPQPSAGDGDSQATPAGGTQVGATG